jgi:hypothetical protein
MESGEYRMSLVRLFCTILAIAVLAGGCTELPSDIGVRPHRTHAVKTKPASHPPAFASWQDDPSAKGNAKITVNLTTQQAFFYRGGVLVGRTNISSGRKDFETPPGKYEVIQKDLHHVSSQYGEYVTRGGAVLRRNVDRDRDKCPAGGHFVGASMPYFLRFTGGYGMHAGLVPRFPASHGCIRLPVMMAKHFFEAAEVGTRVEVIEPPLIVQQ